MTAPQVLATATLRLALCAVHRTLADSLGDDMATWVGAILPGADDSLAGRELKRQLASISDRVAEELLIMHASGADGLPLEKYFEALDVISSVFDSLTYTLVAGRGFENKLPSDLHREFLVEIDREWQADDVDELAREYGGSALTLCCHALLAWVRIIPLDRVPAAWGALVTTTRLIDNCRRMLVEVRKAGVTGTSGSMRVVGTQRRDIASSLGQMELFGLPVEKRFRRVPITVSYLAGKLSATPSRQNSRPLAIDKLITSLAQEKLHEHPSTGIRLLISGKAGCGKTTAVQWVAFTASQQGLQGLAWSGRPLLPLFVRLREAIVSSGLPSDRILLYSAQMQDEVSSTWLQDCHSSVTPLILLDGWDEISNEKKAGAEEWVQSLIRRFPGAHLIVTSRPEGIDKDFFGRLEFRQVSVLPLGRNESAELARRWFEGLVDQLHASPDIKVSEVERARREILSDLSTPDISDMADSPLLVSMLCCLYATGDTTAPDKRGKLYELVVSTLLDSRERDRGSASSEWNKLDLAKKETMVGAIAMAMAMASTMNLPIDNDNKTTVPSVCKIIGDILPALGRSSGESPRWTDALLARSIVLQRVASNEAEFAHRSIQDYLAAKAFRQAGDLDSIYNLADAGQWATLPFTCYSADLETADRTIGWILDRLDQGAPGENRLLLTTLVECLGASTVVSPEIRSEAEGAISQIIPPRDETEAKSLASLGNSVIPYLSSSRVLDEDARRLSIHVLARIGSTEAIRELVNYALESRPGDIEALAAEFERFDPDTYGKSVLREIKSDFKLVLSDGKYVNSISDMEKLTTLVIDKVRLDGNLLSSARRLPRLRRLEITNSSNIGSLEWTTEMPALRTLSLSRSTGVSPLVELGTSGLWALNMNNVDVDVESWEKVLRGKSSLRVLTLLQLSGQIASMESGDLSRLKALQTLAITGDVDVSSLDFLKELSHVSHLTLGRNLSARDLEIICDSSSIRNLDVGFDEHLNPRILDTGFMLLTKLTVRSAPGNLLDSLPYMSALKSLVVKSTNLGSDEFFSVGANVATLKFFDCTLENNYTRLSHRSGEDRFPAVRELVWRKGVLKDLNFLRDIPSLRKLDIEDSGSIESLDGLGYLSSGCFVRIVGTRWGLDESTIANLKRRCEVIYEPEYDSDSFTENFWVDYGGS